MANRLPRQRCQSEAVHGTIYAESNPQHSFANPFILLLQTHSRELSNPMNNNEQPINPADDENAPEEETPDAVPSTPAGDDIDVEGALAAVASLHTLTQEGEPSAEHEAADDEALDAESEYDDLPELYRESDELAPTEDTPTASVAPIVTAQREDRLLRGQAASVVPAFLLIAIGAVLTFWLTTGSDLPSQPILLGGGLVAVGIAMLARWFSSRTHGSLFMGMLLALLGGVVLYLGNSTSPGWYAGWPLWVIAPGIALSLSALVTPSSRSAALPGLILAVSGAAIFLINQGVPDLSPTLSQLWPVALGIGIVLLIVPVLRRQRN